jgi:hypothetical protein
MKPSRIGGLFIALASAGAISTACGSDGGGGTEAQRHGVGAACATDADCPEPGQHCLAFKGGYCGVADCTTDVAGVGGATTVGCPAGSACVAHTDGHNYCFLICVDKPECNLYRPPADEANCSSSVDFVGGTTNAKACVPPSG